MKQDSQEERWASFGWNVLSIPGNDVAAIDEALGLASRTKGKPTVIILNTVKGYGSPIMEDKAGWHHHLPNAEEYARIVADFAARKEPAMPNTVPNRKVICDELLAAAAHDEDIVVLCSDSRGSASLTPFFDEFPERSVEMGIAEQNLVSTAAGMAAMGKRPFAASPACLPHHALLRAVQGRRGVL